MDSTFEGITDILNNLKATSPQYDSKESINNCMQLLNQMSNILNYEYSTRDVIKCNYPIQEKLANIILNIQQTLYNSDSFLSSALETTQISDLLNQVL